MKTHSSILHVRMDTELKQKATAVLAAMGLTASEAVRLLFHRITVDQALPLQLKVPNEETRRAMAEVDEMVKTRAERFASVDEPLEELEDDHPGRKATLKVPNAETRRAMAESEEMMRQGTARFASADEMFAAPKKAGDQ